MPIIAAAGARPFVIDLGALTANLQAFLQSTTLIINIPSKDVAGFGRLINKIAYSNVKHVLFVSSTSVYPATNRIILESDGAESPTHPLTTIENLFTENNNFETTIVRFGGLIGYSRHPGRFFRNRKVVRNPEAFVNLIHRDDCINIIEQIVTRGVWGETFNCCADTHPTKRAFYAQAAAQLGVPAPNFDTSGETVYKIIDNSKIKQALDYSFVHPDLMAIQF